MATLIERLRYSLGGVSTPMMRGDNLAITLCTAFEDPDQEQDENGWTPDAHKGMDEVLNAIHAHYADELTRLSAALTRAESEIAEARIREAQHLEVLSMFAEASTRPSNASLPANASVSVPISWLRRAHASVRSAVTSRALEALTGGE